MQQFIQILSSLFVVSLISSCQNQDQSNSDPRPNIIFIMTDDHAEQAISSYGSQLIQTPNIDRIATEGIRFNNSFVTNSICAPSRAVLLTGQYSHRNGLRDNRDEFDGSQMTFPKLLQEAGYQTAIIGKWHLKTAPTGFDDWKVLIGQGEYYNPQMVHNGDSSQLTGYTTDLITDLALDNLQNRDQEKPFCLLYHHKAPHRNWMPNLKHLALFKKDLPVPATFFDDYRTRATTAGEQDMRIADMFLSLDMKLQPGDYEEETGTGGNKDFDPELAWANSYSRLTEKQKLGWDAHYDSVNQAFREAELEGKSLTYWKYQRYMKDYLRCVVSVDENIGRLLDYLDEEGLADNTLVIYTSDQGFYLGEHGWYDKRFMYEESLSMPLVMRYPPAIPAGQVTNAMTLNLDFAPTLLDFAGVNIPGAMQGQSLRPIMAGKPIANWRSAMYYHYYEYPHGWHNVKKHYGMRNQQYKLIHFYDEVDTWELYDLKNDPKELKNLILVPEFAPIVDQLKFELNKLREQYGDT